MKYIRYTKYTGEPADAVDLEELVQRLSDFFLQSGFDSQFYDVPNSIPTAPWTPSAKPSNKPSPKAA